MTKTQLQQWAQELQYGLEACQIEQQGLRHAVDQVFKLIAEIAGAMNEEAKKDLNAMLHKDLEDLRRHCKFNDESYIARLSCDESRIDLLETELRQLKCQVETKHRNMAYATRRAYVNSVAARPSYHYVFRCAGCGVEVEKTDSQLTDKDREALIALGLLEV